MTRLTLSPVATTKPCEAVSIDSIPAAGSSRSTEWMSLGICRNFAPEVFFPADGAGVEKARKICAVCPVKEHCLEYAVSEQIEHGVWGGMSERARRRLKSFRRAS
jgi:WhiB family redox-sensing transcriptional regulator